MKNMKKLAESLTERDLAELLRFKLLQYKAEIAKTTGGGDPPETIQAKRGKGRSEKTTGPKNRRGAKPAKESG